MKLKKRSEGQALVEFCLLLPLLCLLLAVAIDGGYLLLVYINVHTSVREGAQLAIYDQVYTDDQIRQQVIDNASVAMLKSSEVSVSQTETMQIHGISHRSFVVAVNHAHNFLLVPFIFNQAPIFQVQSRMKSLVAVGLKP